MDLKSRGFWQPLAHRAFRLLFASQLCSDLGTWLDYIAVSSLVVYAWHMGASATAAVITIYSLPWVLIGPFASVWTARVPIRRFMLICHLCRIAAAVGMVYAPSFWVLLPLVFLKSTLSALYDPARQSAIRLVASEAMLAKAVAVSQLSASSTKVIAPAIGGALITLGGPRFPFLVEGAVFAIAALVVALMPAIAALPPGESAHDTEGTSFRRQFREGIAHTFNNPVLAAAVVMAGVSMFIVFLYDGLFPVASLALGLDAQGFGTMIAAVGAGAVLGNVAMGQWKGWNGKPLAIMCRLGIFSGSLVALVGSGTFQWFRLPMWGWLAVMLLIGLLGSSFGVPYGYILQTETPPRLMSRVSALANAFQSAAMLLAPLTGALLAKALDVGGVLILGGALTMTASVTAILYTGRRSFLERTVKASAKSG